MQFAGWKDGQGWVRQTTAKTEKQKRVLDNITGWKTNVRMQSVIRNGNEEMNKHSTSHW